jgi:hypothetical protein
MSNDRRPWRSRKELLALAAQVVSCSFAGSDQIADSLVDHVRHPYPGQLARPLWDQGRRNHHAVVIEFANLPA